MTNLEFSKKWNHKRERGHYGLDIYDNDIISLLDQEFTKLEKDYPNFTFSQIKLKFGSARVYLSNDVPLKIVNEIENKINEILDK